MTTWRATDTFNSSLTAFWRTMFRHKWMPGRQQRWVWRACYVHEHDWKPQMCLWHRLLWQRMPLRGTWLTLGSVKTSTFLFLWYFFQTLTDFANFWQKHTLMNFKEPHIHSSPQFVLYQKRKFFVKVFFLFSRLFYLNNVQWKFYQERWEALLKPQNEQVIVVVVYLLSLVI